MLLPAVLLAIMLGGLVLFLKGDLAEFRQFRIVSGNTARQRRYRGLIAKAMLAFAGPAIFGLAVLGRIDAIVDMPAEFADARALLPAFDGDRSGLLGGLLGGMAIGGLMLGAFVALHRGRVPKPLGNVASLLPRNRSEIVHAAALSVSAGVTEELAFRLTLPLMIVMVGGGAIIAFAVSLMLFGAMHRYQGWIGVLATTIVGLLMTAVYLMTGSLWIAMLLHTLIDLNGLVLRPILAGMWTATD